MSREDEIRASLERRTCRVSERMHGVLGSGCVCGSIREQDRADLAYLLGEVERLRVAHDILTKPAVRYGIRRMYKNMDVDTFDGDEAAWDEVVAAWDYLNTLNKQAHQP